MGMNKERWIESYEEKIEEICEEYNIEYDEAEIRLQRRLTRDPGYLDEYHYNRLVDIAECYAE